VIKSKALTNYWQGEPVKNFRHTSIEKGLQIWQQRGLLPYVKKRIWAGKKSEATLRFHKTTGNPAASQPSFKIIIDFLLFIELSEI